MEKLIEVLVQSGGIVRLVVFIIPGFIAWKTAQLRLPQGEQKAADVFVDIFGMSVFISLLWFNKTWSQWPTTINDALVFFLQIFMTPVVVSLIKQFIFEFMEKRNWITSPHPRAWDFIFNNLALKNKSDFNGLFLILKLKNNDKVAGVYSNPGFASLWPYERDLFLGPMWQLEEGRPARAVAGSIGLYIDAASIDSIEVLDYNSVLQSVQQRMNE